MSERLFCDVCGNPVSEREALISLGRNRPTSQWPQGPGKPGGKFWVWQTHPGCFFEQDPLTPEELAEAKRELIGPGR